MPEGRSGAPARLIASVAPGTLLNPLNSSMIAVALVPLQHEFEVGVATSSWLVSGFYLAAAVGQPLMGRFVDLFGARRMFLAGLGLVCAVSVVAPFAPGFWWLVGARVLLAFGTSTAYPAALVLIRAAAAGPGQGSAGGGRGRTPSAPSSPAGALAALSIAAATSAALGPVIGGFLIASAGWQAVFLVNVPVTAVGALLAIRFLPRLPHPPRQRGDLLKTLDLPGTALFTATLAGLLIFLLSLADHPQWWLVPAVVVLGVLLVVRERSTAVPFLDVRGLAANRHLSSVLIQQGGVNLVFYCVFFGLPLWLGSVRGFTSDTVGLLVLPVAAMGVLMTPVAAAMVGRRGSRATLVLGSVVLLVAALTIQVLDDSTPLVILVGVALLFGIPGGFNNLGLQTALYEASPPSRMGSSGGLFQTFRYLGAILSTSVLGIVFEHELSSRGLHQVGLIMTCASVVLVILALAWHGTARRVRASVDDL
ncbi:MFS transporter [Actinopolymorpha alba]|uniref:MFS transporter n=1 Tax=Actinopolymorpha alba TaxID=533267 RepID=UPI00035DB5BE|nr:MFS transporter [Actinopolymorpha alba]